MKPGRSSERQVIARQTADEQFPSKDLWHPRASIVTNVADSEVRRDRALARLGTESRLRSAVLVSIALLAAVIAAGCASGGGSHAGAQATTTLAPIPVDIHVDGTAKLTNGQGVQIHVAAKSGSLTYGYEARLCAGGATFQFDSDMRPTKSGKCAVQPLSAGSDNYQEVRASPPYLVADSVFHVGVGSGQLTMENGTPITITCGPGNPCQLVLKVQYPNGFAIRAYPLTYA